MRVVRHRLALCAAGLVFLYVVARLSHTLLSADADHRRHAARRLVILAVVPALLLTPAAVDRTPSELHAEIMIAGVVWATLAMAYTSFLTHRAMENARRSTRERDPAPSDASLRVASRLQP